MNVKLHFASLVTLGLLSGFVLAIILAAAYAADIVSAGFVIGMTVLFNIVMWLINPFISDLIYKWFYNVTFYEYDQIKNKTFMRSVKRICNEHNIKVPKIGIIKDKNPTAFTYGSASFNARIVVTEGLFTFLNNKEVDAVLAHELGHIIHRDFIVMSIAATLLEVLYEFYVIFSRSRMRSVSHSRYGLGKKGEKRDGTAYLLVLGYISLLFYWIGTYILLYLSRLREYYADQFSAEKTGDPNLLSSALIKIAYGIATVPDTQRTAHLLNNTRAQGIFDHKAANETGLVFHNAKKRKGLIEKALLFDLVNPWAWVLQLKSTHPLVGKRIRKLCEMTDRPSFDFAALMQQDIDRTRLWKNFFTDVLINYSVPSTFIASLILLLLQFFLEINLLVVIIICLFLFVISSIIKVRYKYPLHSFTETTVIDCMADLYASPVRGKPIALTGRAIGRGQAGYIFGEDSMFQDKTGIIYLNYESAIPLFGNLYFAWKKMESWLRKPATAKGWFLRGTTHHIELYQFSTEKGTLESYVRFWQIMGVIMSLLAAIWFIWFFTGLVSG